MTGDAATGRTSSAPPRLLAGIEIRPLLPGDSISEITALLHRGYARLAEMGFNYTAVDQDDETTRRRCDEGETFVAVLDGRIVGTVTLRNAAKTSGCTWYDREDVASVGQLAVEPSIQGGGLGGALMDRAEARAAEMGVTDLAGDTSEGAAHLIRFYEARGYRVVDRVEWPGKTYTSVILSKSLKATS